MTVKCVSSTIYDPLEFIGLSTDTKPTLEERNAGSTFFETDTKTGYLWDGAAWNSV